MSSVVTDRDISDLELPVPKLELRARFMADYDEEDILAINAQGGPDASDRISEVWLERFLHGKSGRPRCIVADVTHYLSSGYPTYEVGGYVMTRWSDSFRMEIVGLRTATHLRRRGVATLLVKEIQSQAASRDPRLACGHREVVAVLHEANTLPQFLLRKAGFRGELLRGYFGDVDGIKMTWSCEVRP